VTTRRIWLTERETAGLVAFAKDAGVSVHGIVASSLLGAVRAGLPGDATLVAYTDGVTEAFNPDNEAYGIERLQAALQPQYDAREQCQRLIAQVHAFTNPAPQSDDITVLAIQLRRDASVPARLLTDFSPNDLSLQELTHADAIDDPA